ncbi:hypothetical protein AB0I28_10190 [Phytomonospora sp. NPDC050363]|uniref:hypothetical protein n=1 Tax=Phytomonospora sp. NPDC050363 TaxID=3155642 RepID=UPI0033D7E403
MDEQSFAVPESPSWPTSRRTLPIVLASLAALVVAAAALLVWSPWSEREFAADEVPSSCADLAAVKDAELPGSPPGKEEVFDRPGYARVENGDMKGTTLMCGWATEELVLTLYLEFWADGVDAAAESFAGTMADFAHGESPDVGDEAVYVLQQSRGALAYVRTGNVIVKAAPTAAESGDLTDEDVIRLLTALVEAIEG